MNRSPHLCIHEWFIVVVISLLHHYSLTTVSDKLKGVVLTGVSDPDL